MKAVETAILDKMTNNHTASRDLTYSWEDLEPPDLDALEVGKEMVDGMVDKVG